MAIVVVARKVDLDIAYFLALERLEKMPAGKRRAWRNKYFEDVLTEFYVKITSAPLGEELTKTVVKTVNVVDDSLTHYQRLSKRPGYSG